VESPAKAKTIKKYLGKDFEVLASYGHVRDLVPKEGAVDPEHHFAMKYQVVERNQKHVDAISRALKKAKSLFLATDPDREGEAISWHLYELLKAQGELEGKSVQRVVFYEITKNSVREAMASPRELSVDLVNAQQARRALDFLVGFNLSPLLWKKVRPGLSAGRVQSPALRMICEREDEIAAFIAREYWTIDAELEHSAQRFPGKLIEYQGSKVEQFSFTTEAQAREVERTLQSAANGRLTVLTVDRKQRKRNPAPPFTTSTLQQEAARKLSFSAQKTMRVAQPGAGGDRPDPRSHRAVIRTGRTLRRAADLQDEIEERPGSARGNPPHRGEHPARGHREQTRLGPVSAVFPDLEAHRGLSNGPRHIRYGGRGHAGGRRPRSARSRARGFEPHRGACQRVDLGQAGIHIRVSGRHGRCRAG
jgi:reverse gyrase